MSKQNLNSSLGTFDTNNCQKRIENEKITTPQSKGVQKLKKPNHWTLLNT